MSETGMPDEGNREKLANATEADVIEELRKQGIYDLDDLVRKTLANIHNQLETESGGESHALVWEGFAFYQERDQ